MASKIFINYRRDDAAAWAGRIYDRLARDFRSKQLFIDVDNIAPGLDFVRILEQQVSACDAFLCIIGKNWLAPNPDGKQRIDEPDDFVRIEIESALRQDVHIIPVLVDGAKMPRAEELPEPIRPLTRRNAVEVTHARFGPDSATLVEALKRTPAPSRQSRTGNASAEQRQADTTSSDDYAPIDAQRLSMWDIAVAAGCLGLALLIGIWSGVGPVQGFLASCAIYAIAALSISFLIRDAGLASAGHVLFFAAGGIASFVALEAGWPFVAGLALGPLAGGVIAALLGTALAALPAIYFMAATLLLAVCTNSIVLILIGADSRVVRVPLTPGWHFYIILSALGATYALLKLAERAPTQSAYAMLAQLLRTRRDKSSSYFRQLMAIAISGAVCGLAGSLFVLHTADFSYGNFGFETSLLFLAIALLGMRLLSGAIVGAVIPQSLMQLNIPYVDSHIAVALAQLEWRHLG